MFNHILCPCQIVTRPTVFLFSAHRTVICPANTTCVLLFINTLRILLQTTIMLAISSYINVEMWIVSWVAVISLTVFCLVTSIIRKQKPTHLFSAVKGAPWGLVPFVLSMFVLVTCLKEVGVTEKAYELLSQGNEIFAYGVSSFLTSNVINNIPMSVLFSKIIENGAGLGAFYSSVIGSNLGAFLTPIGALAGIMWHSLLKTHEVKYSYLDFIKTGVLVSVPTLLVALLSLSIFI